MLSREANKKSQFFPIVKMAGKYVGVSICHKVLHWKKFQRKKIRPVYQGLEWQLYICWKTFRPFIRQYRYNYNWAMEGQKYAEMLVYVSHADLRYSAYKAMYFYYFLKITMAKGLSDCRTSQVVTPDNLAIWDEIVDPVTISPDKIVFLQYRKVIRETLYCTFLY